MRTEIIYESRSLYRDSFRVKAYLFGGGSKTLCVVGNLRGNEYQQLYTCSRLVEGLRRAEEEDLLAPGHEIMVIPSANPYSLNTGKRFWPIDNTDINRMFPGYDQGETTQRIAAGIFARVQDYAYGIHLASNYMTGQFMPYLNIMKTGLDYVEEAKDFGLPYVVLRSPRPYDTTTLNYNWQIWNTKAFSMYTTSTEQIHADSALRGVRAVFSFLAARGVLRSAEGWWSGEEHIVPRIVEDREILSVRTPEAGLFIPQVKVEQRVRAGESLARIVSPIDGEVLAHLYAPGGGVVFFLADGPLVYGHTAVIKLIPDGAGDA